MSPNTCHSFVPFPSLFLYSKLCSPDHLASFPTMSADGTYLSFEDPQGSTPQRSAFPHSRHQPESLTSPYTQPGSTTHTFILIHANTLALIPARTTPISAGVNFLRETPSIFTLSRADDKCTTCRTNDSQSHDPNAAFYGFNSVAQNQQLCSGYVDASLQWRNCGGEVNKLLPGNHNTLWSGDMTR